ncbi:magnesium/cobalt transporter CorA [Hahella sp. SMD15-11]|uniref:Magnesium transport protein CorA n=1 Tax=Thermohahella caldifontis TaxID=3142973 RepID=A0AB39UU05_9GAMM
MTDMAKTGLPPGSLIHVGEEAPSDTTITLCRYTRETLDVTKDIPPDDLIRQLEQPFNGTTWVRIEGLADTAFFAQLAEHVGIHALVMEDVLNTHQRAKLEDYDNYIYAVLRHTPWQPDTEDLADDQISFILAPHLVITFSETATPLFDPVAERLKNGAGRLRNHEADYLFYALMDVVVDGYIQAHDELDDVIFELEESLLSGDTEQATLVRIQDMKRALLRQRKAIQPVATMLDTLIREDHPLIRPVTQPYLRDVEDHAQRVLANLESSRELLGSMLDIYLSLASNRMNETMKVLTVFAAIFIPLTFVAGVYGMNFEYMPELKWRWGYPAVWGVFVTMAGGLLVYFKRKQWL